jgi:hypothetical protein
MIAAVNIPVMFQNEAISACSTMGAERRGISHNHPEHKIKVLYENFPHIVAGNPFVQDSVQKSAKLQGIDAPIRNPAIDSFHQGDKLQKMGAGTFQIFVYVFWMKAIPVVDYRQDIHLDFVFLKYFKAPKYLSRSGMTIFVLTINVMQFRRTI